MQAQVRSGDVTCHIIACLSTSRDICSQGGFRFPREDEIKIRHTTVPTQNNNYRRALHDWTVRWSQMPQITLIRQVSLSALEEALASLHAAGYYVVQYASLYNRTVNHPLVGWNSDPLVIYRVSHNDDSDSLSAFNFAEWRKHILHHQLKLDKIRLKMYDLIRSKGKFERTWAELRNNMGTELRDSIDTWWKEEIEPMVHDAVLSVGSLKPPLCESVCPTTEQLLGMEQEVDLPIHRQTALSLGFDVEDTPFENPEQ